MPAKISPPQSDAGNNSATPLGQGWETTNGWLPDAQDPPMSITERIDRYSSVRAQATPASPTNTPTEPSRENRGASRSLCTRTPYFGGGGDRRGAHAERVGASARRPRRLHDPFTSRGQHGGRRRKTAERSKGGRDATDVGDRRGHPADPGRRGHRDRRLPRRIQPRARGQRPRA